MELHVEMLHPFVKPRIAGEGNSKSVVGHDVRHRRSKQVGFRQKSAEPLQVKDGVVLAYILGVSRGRSHFPLSVGRPGNWCSCKFKHIARCGVCTISDDRATKVGICVSRSTVRCSV